MSAGIDLVVDHDGDRKAWVVRPFGDYGINGKVFAVTHTKAEAIAIGEVLGKVFAEFNNNSDACELYIRTKNGRIQDKRTYGRDPETSVG